MNIENKINFSLTQCPIENQSRSLSFKIIENNFFQDRTLLNYNNNTYNFSPSKIEENQNYSPIPKDKINLNS